MCIDICVYIEPLMYGMSLGYFSLAVFAYYYAKVAFVAYLYIRALCASGLVG